MVDCCAEPRKLLYAKNPAGRPFYYDDILIYLIDGYILN
ncbi:hypothetical protein D1AOALGA4SA_7800 [Olavius algarvensis Delta 1 endosymbiont]|nr:hypothetical protein D1AOALGA4SA_7800 [Olavius algarvensis Delta 1 endosymbiont]